MSIAELLAPELFATTPDPDADSRTILGLRSKRLLPTTAIVHESRINGRIHYLVAQYSDGSEIHYQWNEETGTDYRVVAGAW